MAEKPKVRPPVEPKGAASILLVRDGQTGLEVLMIERAKTMKFAPGAFVFPGGKVDEGDTGHWRWHGMTTGRGVRTDLSYRVAALRELYEEADVLYLEKYANTLKRRGMPFSCAVRLSGLKLDTEALVPFAHWVTPEVVPRRFDTHFYVAPHRGQIAKHDGSEAVSLRWVSPRRLLAEWESDRVPLMFPTRLNLMKLARSSTVADALLQARRSKVIRTQPKLTIKGDTVHLEIQKEAGFGVTKATSKELAVERPS